MRAIKSVLSGKGLLTASIALLSGQALAETAGRVSFVNGEVTASAANGQSRVLKRGDSINGGDKISTRGGRVQIRFTDGGFVSLQPNSVFSVDEYLYTNRKPEETSLFFSLLQGGMRTITGTIGKVNKQSYQVRTPVATIGIRGTEYLASVTDDGLRVSVGAGLVNVANEAGNVTGGAGQNIAVKGSDSAPQLSTEKAEVLATGTNGDEEVADENSEDKSLDATVAVGNVQDESGSYLFLFEKSSPGYTAAYSYPTSATAGLTGTAGGYLVDPTYNGSDTSLTLTFDGGGLVKGTHGSFAIFDRGNAVPLPDHGGSDRALTWGAWYADSDQTPGGASITIGGSDLTLGAGQVANYIVGSMTPVSAIVARNGQSATYTYQGGTPAIGTDGTGGEIRSGSTLGVSFGATSITMNVNLLLDVAESDGITTTTYSMSQSGINMSLSSTATFGSSVTCGGASSCSASINGFFAGSTGDQIGLAYKVTDSDLGRMHHGTAAFSEPTSPPLVVTDGL